MQTTTARMRPSTFFALLALLLGVASIATADNTGATRGLPVPQGTTLAPSQSIGLPWAGRLRGGIRVNASGALYNVASEYHGEGNYFAVASLARTLEDTARYLAGRFPGGRLPLGELSMRNGGNIIGHRSHTNGRDVDIGFYLRDEAGRFATLNRLVSVRPDGVARTLQGEPSLRFDDAANWALVERLVRSSDVSVQYLFVSNRLKRRLLDYAQRSGAELESIERANRVMMQPGRHPHDNHFHVRVYCDAQDRPSCVDRGPFWDWVPNMPSWAQPAPRLRR